jgi:hypothetical protein
LQGSWLGLLLLLLLLQELWLPPLQLLLYRLLRHLLLRLLLRVLLHLGEAVHDCKEDVV